MVKIRLVRTGKRNNPSYRIAVLDHHTKAKGTAPIEEIGYYNPGLKKDSFKYDKDRYIYWIKEGAQPTKSITELIDGKYKYVKYSPKKAETSEKESEKSSELTEPTETAPIEPNESA